MNKEKLIQYKSDLKTPYTGLINDMIDTINDTEVKDDINMDLNNDGIVDKKDISLAAKVLARSRKKKINKGD